MRAKKKRFLQRSMVGCTHKFGLVLKVGVFGVAGPRSWKYGEEVGPGEEK